MDQRQERQRFEDWWKRSGDHLAWYSHQGVAWRAWLEAQGMEFDVNAEGERISAAMGAHAARREGADV